MPRHPWESDPAFADLVELAKRLESALGAANDALLKVAALSPDELHDRLAGVQARILGFDGHNLRRFHEALEEKRVKTLAQGNIFMACVLSSAVALSEFKNQPRHAGSRALSKGIDRLRDISTNGLSLSAFALMTFYALLGRGLWQHLSTLQSSRRSLLR